MKLHQYMMMIILIGLVFLAAITYMDELGAEHNYNVSSNYTTLSNISNRLDNQQVQTARLAGLITNMTIDTGGITFIDIPYKLIQIGVQSVRVFFGQFPIMMSIFSDIENGLILVGIPVPNWLVPNLFALFILLISAIMIYAFFKWKFED